MTRRTLALGVVCLLVASAAAAQQPEPYMAIGAWKLNPAKSTGSSNQLRSRSRIHTIEDRGDGVLVNKTEQINADGSHEESHWTLKNDGREYPMLGVAADGKATVLTVSSTRVDAYTVRWAFKNTDGKVVAGGLRTVSKDGKTYTLSGGASGSVTVYDRQ